MMQYYLYLLDSAGRIKAREILTAADDAAAITQGEGYLRDHTSVPGVEVWLGERIVTALSRTAAA
jgi:hypothetical protein